MPPKLTTEYLRRLIVGLALISLALIWIVSRDPAPVLAQSQAANYKNFEGPQVHPLALTPDGTRLLAVNTPNNSLSVFHLTGRSLTLMAEIPVGLEPVSVAARNDREVWVTNWLSDSVSVVDLQTWNVTRTFDAGDEPTDVVFTGQPVARAFVCVSGLSQVKVYDPTNAAAMPQTLTIRGKQPRALTRNASGSQVFVSVFESGNQTTTIAADLVTANGGPPPPSPALKPGLPAAPNVGLIVKWNGSSWSDERNDGRWTAFIPYSLADIDVVVLDASGASAAVSREVRNVGTHIGNAVVDPTGNQLLVLNDEARNNVRFEPNLQGHFLNTRLSVVGLANANVTAVDLNQHINYGVPAGSDIERANSLALPADLVRATDGTLYVAATGSAKVGVLGPTGVVQARIAVGQGPTGLALNPTGRLLYVLNRFDETVSIVDTTTRAQLATVPVGFNPEPDNIRRGRHGLYDATLSAHGDLACASCHANGHRDGIAWDLGSPQGSMQTVPNPIGAIFGFGSSVFHPMKGPMTTQSLRGIIGTEPLHWRGDRGQLASFNPAFPSLLGGPRQLSQSEMADFQSFIESLSYPPNPNENPDRTLPNPLTGPSAMRGSQLFNTAIFDGGIFTCNQCHVASPGFGTGTGGFLIPGVALQESQDFKVPQLRGAYQKTGFIRAPGEQLTGYGFIHDGSTDTLLTFLHAPVFTFQNDNQRRDLEQFVLSFDTGTAPAVGLQTTANAANKTAPAVTDRINLSMAQATAGNCDLVVRGLYGGAPRSFRYNGNGLFQTDKQNEPLVTLPMLLQTVGISAELTFTGVPVGAGRRDSIDRNEDNVLNGDEALTPNALDTAEFFVWQHYEDFFNRDPDQGGLDYWTGQITQCGTDALCLHNKRIDVSNAFFFELEYQQTAAYVFRLYRAAYGNDQPSPNPDNSNQTEAPKLPSYAAFAPDRAQVVGGSSLAQSQLDLANAFVLRPAFLSKYPASLTLDQFVDALLLNIKNDSGADLAAQRSALKALGSRGAVLYRVADDNVQSNPISNQVFIDAEYNRAFVFSQYAGYLRRDSDLAGFLFWLGQVNNAPLRDVAKQHAMVCSFITAAEYQLRSGPSVTRTNRDCTQ
jgi:YVTN family beta-propeller protein